MASETIKKYQPTKDAEVVKIMVLETDKPDPKSHSEKGSFGDIVHHHFSQAGADHHPPLGVVTDQIFVVEDQGGRAPSYEELEGFDGVLLTGSMYDAHGDDEWIFKLLDLLRELWTKRPNFKFTGVCFGHQILARLLGAPIEPSPSGDWELGHCSVELTSTGQRLFRTTASHIHLHQMHQDHVVRAPTPRSSAGLLRDADPAVECWGRSDHTEIQGLYLPNRLFTTQAHLAFDEDMVRRQIKMREESGSIRDQEHADRAKETAHLEHDGQEVAQAILRLFRYDDEGRTQHT